MDLFFGGFHIRIRDDIFVNDISRIGVASRNESADTPTIIAI